jgi:hypothetical protein
VKKVLIVFGMLITTLVAAAAIFWFGWLTPPDSTEVCTNVDAIIDKDGHKLMKGKAGELPKGLADQALKQAKKAASDHCKRFSTEKPLMLAQAVWVKRLKCMRDARDIGALEACDEIRSF